MLYAARDLTARACAPEYRDRRKARKTARLLHSAAVGLHPVIAARPRELIRTIDATRARSS